MWQVPQTNQETAELWVLWAVLWASRDPPTRLLCNLILFDEAFNQHHDLTGH